MELIVIAGLIVGVVGLFYLMLDTRKNLEAKIDQESQEDTDLHTSTIGDEGMIHKLDKSFSYINYCINLNGFQLYHLFYRLYDSSGHFPAVPVRYISFYTEDIYTHNENDTVFLLDLIQNELEYRGIHYRL